MTEMKKRCKRTVCALLVVMLTAAFLTTTQGSSVDSLQKDIEELQEAQEQLQQQMDSTMDQQNSLQDQLNSTEDQVNQLQKQQQEIQKNIEELDAQLGQAVKEMNDIETQQQAKQTEIDAANVNLEAAQEKEQQQYENMKLRIRYMYEQGSQNYLSVLFAAADAADLLYRAEYITNIYQYDRKMLTQYEEAKNTVEEQKNLLSQQYAELEQLRAQAAEKKALAEQLVARKNEELQKNVNALTAVKSLAQQYQEQIDQREQIIAQLEAASYQTSVQQDQALAALTAMLSQSQDAQREQAEAAAAQAVLQKLAEEEQQKLNSEGGYTLKVDPNTLFVWPCPSSTRITSNYGYRLHPIYHEYRLHNGIDIGADMGSAIVAAYKGTVIGAGYNSSMGNYVMIDHGQGLVTIYMHASYLCVSAGDYVESGQLIALVGATGDVTGPHLHFTTRLNGNYVSPWNYVSN